MSSNNCCLLRRDPIPCPLYPIPCHNLYRFVGNNPVTGTDPTGLILGYLPPAGFGDGGGGGGGFITGAVDVGWGSLGDPSALNWGSGWGGGVGSSVVDFQIGFVGAGNPDVQDMKSGQAGQSDSTQELDPVVVTSPPWQELWNSISSWFHSQQLEAQADLPNVTSALQISMNIAQLATGAGEVSAVRTVVKTEQALALGLESHGLQAFAEAKGAKLATGDNWQEIVRQGLADPNTTVHVNLDGVDVWGGVSRAAAGIEYGATDWELLQIYQNPQYWDTIQFWRGGVQVPNPFQ